MNTEVSRVGVLLPYQEMIIVLLVCVCSLLRVRHLTAVLSFKNRAATFHFLKARTLLPAQCSDLSAWMAVGSQLGLSFASLTATRNLLHSQFSQFSHSRILAVLSSRGVGPNSTKPYAHSKRKEKEMRRTRGTGCHRCVLLPNIMQTPQPKHYPLSMLQNTNDQPTRMIVTTRHLGMVD